MSLILLKSGLQTSVQDLGRPGHQRDGVTVGGAADSFSARLANALVGNPDGAALLEMALIGPDLRMESEKLVAWCGAEFEARLDGHLLPSNRPVRVPAEAVVTFGGTRRGARAWLAVAGGIDVPLVLGSRSTCRRFGFGGLHGRSLVTGDRLRFGAPSAWAQGICRSLKESGRPHWDWSVRPASLSPPAASDKIRALPGPEWEWFDRESRERFFSTTYCVTKDADRMGVRLQGPALTLESPREMISSGVNAGVVQVPADGQPIILLCSRQTVGGYPRLAAVAAVDYGRLAQLKQGDPVAFEEIELRQAHELYLARERDFHVLRKELFRRTC